MTDAMELPQPRTFCPPERRIHVLIAAILASSMGFIDGSVVAIATPAIRSGLGASLSDALWISNAYMLFLASLILIGGAAGDRFGLRRVFGLGIAAFTGASLLCALAPNPAILIVARALQGIGAAFMVPGSLAIIAKAYPRAERGRAIGTWAAASSLTTILGPVVGGFILTSFGDFGWRFVFAINLPLGAAALLLLWLKVPADVPGERRRLDWPGGLTVTLALLALTLGLTGEGGEGSLPDPQRALALAGAGVALLMLFIIIEARIEAPMMPLRLFAVRAFSGANGLTFCLYFALAAISFYQPMMLIAGWGRTPAEVALSFLPLGICLTLLSRYTGRLADRYGAGPPIAAGSVLVALAFAGLGLTAPLENLWGVTMPLMTLMGIGMGLVVSPLSTAVMTGIDDTDTGVASGINNAVARVAGLVAVASMGVVVTLVFEHAAAAPGLSFGRPVPPGQIAPDLETARVAATNMAFAAVAWITAGLAALSGLIAFLTLERKPGARAEVAPEA